jgi:branched-subunit amino acid transport protein
MIWAAIILGSLGCWIEKLLGYLVPATALRNPWVMRVATFIPVALLAALVAVQTFGNGQSLTLDARAAGLAVAVLALILRAPFLVVIVVAAITAALLRAAGWAT